MASFGRGSSGERSVAAPRRRAAALKERGTGCVPGRPVPPVGGVISVVVADRHSGHALKHLHDRSAVFFVEPGGAGHLVDLLRHVGEQQRHAEVLSKCGSSSWSLYEMSIVPP